MFYLVVQIAVFLGIAVLLGVGIGWWMARYQYSSIPDELATQVGLQQQYQEMISENTTLRLRLQQAEQALQAAIAPQQAQARELVQLRKQLADVERSFALQSHTKSLLMAAPLTLEPEIPDDLTLIQGINQRVADTFRALGIVKYRQIAEFTADDVCSIRRIIAAEDTLPLEQWVENAQTLCQQQCQPITTEPCYQH